MFKSCGPKRKRLAGHNEIGLCHLLSTKMGIFCVCVFFFVLFFVVVEICSQRLYF